MTTSLKELLFYQTRSGKSPFEGWLEGLKDRRAVARIRARLNRLAYLGHAGDFKPAGRGVYELKIHFGPGYRVYFAKHKEAIILLLCGGDKGTQDHDIKKAVEYWEDYKQRI